MNTPSPCPFCLDTYLELEEVRVNDGIMSCVVCSNCGMRGPGAWDGDEEFAWQNWNEMAQMMGPIWNKEHYPVGMDIKLAAKSMNDEPTIIIRTGGGAVWDVENLPDGWQYEVIDEEDEDE